MQQIYKSSRFTSGNFWFPDTLALSEKGIDFKKSRLFGSSEEHLGLNSVSSVKISSGIFFANLLIETSGGSQPIVMHGLSRKIANKIREFIQSK